MKADSVAELKAEIAAEHEEKRKAKAGGVQLGESILQRDLLEKGIVGIVSKLNVHEHHDLLIITIRLSELLWLAHQLYGLSLRDGSVSGVMGVIQ